MAHHEHDPHEKSVLLTKNTDFLAWHRYANALSIAFDFPLSQFGSTENVKERDPVDEHAEAAPGREAAPTYVEWDTRDRKFSGLLLKSIREPNLSDIAFTTWDRIKELPADHADAWKKSYSHAFIMLALREQCVKHEFNDKRMAEIYIDQVAKGFTGDFEEYHANFTKAVNNALRVGVVLTDNMMKSCFNNNIDSSDRDWITWKVIVMEGIDTNTFQDIMKSGLAHDSNHYDVKINSKIDVRARFIM